MFVDYDYILDTPELNAESTKQFLNRVNHKISMGSKAREILNDTDIHIANDGEGYQKEYRLIDPVAQITLLRTTLTPMVYFGPARIPCFYINMWISLDETRDQVCQFVWRKLCEYIPKRYPIMIVYEAELEGPQLRLVNSVIKARFYEGFRVYHAAPEGDELIRIRTKEALPNVLQRPCVGTRFFISSIILSEIYE